MQDITVEVHSDYLERMTGSRQPLLSLAELIWNGVDADATTVTISFKENALGGLEEIRISDNGHGIDYNDAVPAFKNLGGSLKRNKNRSRLKKRQLHGKAGKGRFRAFS